MTRIRSISLFLGLSITFLFLSNSVLLWAIPHPSPKKLGKKKLGVSIRVDALELSNPLLTFELGDLVLVSTRMDKKRPRAVLKDPRGKTHIIQVGDYIGKELARVSQISKKGIMVRLKETRQSQSRERMLVVKNQKGGKK